MRHFVLGVIIGLIFGSAVTAIAAGATKWEYASNDAKSVVGYGTDDAGDTITRIKTDTDGNLYIVGV